ncbi:MAG TPA: NAD-dependent epimerase/dehydratase family protein, partial [Roseiflexaceae bacterium]|nr:NAD-dependent epimerase/dehydratase family protein [Roseiflexaceae bacterium]
EQGWRVRVLDNLSSGKAAMLGPAQDTVELVVGDVRNADVVAHAAAGCTAIFHLAAMVSVIQSVEEPRQAYETNLLGTLNVLDAARRSGAERVVLASTCAIYGDTEKLPVSETDLPRPLSPYAATKLAAEHACNLYTHLYGLETVALRFFNVYGPRQDPASPYAAVVPKFVELLRAGKQPTIYGDGQQTRDFIFVGDIVRALQTAATAPGIGGEVFNVGRGQEYSVLDLAEAIADLLGIAVEPRFAPSRTGEVRHSRADISRFATLAGFHAETGLVTGLAATIGDSV